MLWVIPVVVAIIYLKGYYDMFQPKGNTYLIPWMIVGIAMLILVGWIVFGHSKKNKKLEIRGGINYDSRKNETLCKK